MSTFRILEIKKSVFEGNDLRAASLRTSLMERGIFLLNLMSSPGSGKTTTLRRTVEALKAEMKLGVMEADLDSDVDARTIADTGIKVIQLHTGGMCHLDAEMTSQGIEGLGADGLDLVFLENVGNLICPADFDTGAAAKVMILSTPEGDDKPLKYPHMFAVCDALLINKMDAASFFDFKLDACIERVRALNPDIQIFPISAKTGEGMDVWFDWLRRSVASWKSKK